MVSMRERAEIAGGWFRVTSSEGKGCVVEFWIPDNKDGVLRAA
jgi:signal transduction histidine kinase